MADGVLTPPPIYDGTTDLDRHESTLHQSKSNKKTGPPSPSQDNMSGNTMAGETTAFGSDLEKSKAAEGEQKFNRLGWKRLTVVLIVEAIALGSLSLPSAFATLGMVAGVICSVGLGLVAIYTSNIVGQTKILFPQISHYADVGLLLGGRRFGRLVYEVIGVMFVLQLVFLVGSHTLTGSIALLNITDNGACTAVLSLVAAIILLLLAVPPSFAEVAILGYIDFASIILAIGVTMIATGIEAADAPGGLSAVPWSAWPKDGVTFTEAFVAITNIVFAYSFAITMFSFMDEMHTPSHYPRSTLALGLIEIFIYTITGAVIYAFVGPDVKAPALLSGSRIVSKVAFGIGLPVIFISGSINTTVAARYIHGRAYKGTITAYINTKKGWITWLALITFITIIAYVIAEAIPFFEDLLSISSALFISGFTFYFPALMWFMLICEGKWYSRKNLPTALANALVFIIGAVTLVGGTYAAVSSINQKFADGTVNGVFTCKPIS